MEQPTIFYAIVFALVLMDFDAPINVWLAWGYVALRIVHSIVQATVNIVRYRADPVRAEQLLPARPDRPRGAAAALAAEAGGKLDVGRPAELADRPHPVEPIAAIDQHPGVAGEGRRIAADISDPRRRSMRRARRPARSAPGPRRVEHHRVEPRRVRRVERAAVKVAMLDRELRRGPLERQHRIARRFGGIDLARQRQREGAEAGEQVGDRSRVRRPPRAPPSTSAASPSSVAWRKPPGGKATGTPDKVIVAGSRLVHAFPGPSPWSRLSRASRCASAKCGQRLDRLQARPARRP